MTGQALVNKKEEKNIMMKKLLTLFLALLMTVSAAGCSSGTKSEPAAEGEASTETSGDAAAEESGGNADVTLTFMASQDWIQDAELELAEQFTEETGIKVDYQIVPADQYTNLLMTKLNTGECTDIFCSQAGQFDIVTQLNVDECREECCGCQRQRMGGPPRSFGRC